MGFKKKKVLYEHVMEQINLFTDVFTEQNLSLTF